MKYENIILEKKDRIAEITLNRPETRNALNGNLLLDLKEALEQIQKEDVGVVIITGAGESFCAGMDIKAIGGEEEEKVDAISMMMEVLPLLENMEQPVIAAVNGYCLTGGMELSGCCDLIIASENAMFGDTHARLSAIPGGGNTQRLPRLVGIRKAKEMLFTCDLFPAEEAERFGLVNKVVAPDKLREAARELATKILSNDQKSVGRVKRLVNQGERLDFESALELERTEFFSLLPVLREGLAKRRAEAQKKTRELLHGSSD